MKNLSHLLPLSAEKAATVVAFSFFGLNAFAALQSGPVTVAAPTATGAHSAPTTAPVAPEEDILDIRGPIHIPAAFPWAAWTAGSLAAVGLGCGAWAVLRRPRRQLPYEIALANLEKLRGLMQPESAQAFSLAVSEIVRLFIEECLPVRAAHRTTNEFLHDLVNLPASPLAAHRETLAEFLQHCDLAKFARWSLTGSQMEAMLASARAFVVAIGKPKPAKKQPGVPQPAKTQVAAAVTANA